MTPIGGRWAITAALLLAFSAARSECGIAAGAEGEVEVKLGTLAPRGTSLHRILLEMGQQWNTASEGKVRLTVYAGGQQGGEAEMVRRMMSGQLTAAMVSAVGLSNIDRSTTCLQYMPLVFRSWEEVDYVREHIGPVLEKRLLDRGFVLLAWADAGWVRFFSRTPVVSPDDLKKLDIFAWQGDPYQIDLMKTLGYHPVPLETGDILQGLTRKMIDAVALTPFFALATQCDRVARNMLALDWAPFAGGVVIRKSTWDQIPAASIEKMRRIAQETGVKLRVANRRECDESVKAMQVRGLKVNPLTPAAEAEWRRLAEGIYPKIRGHMVPEDMFDQVRELLKEYRNGRRVDTQ